MVARSVITAVPKTHFIRRDSFTRLELRIPVVMHFKLHAAINHGNLKFPIQNPPFRSWISQPKADSRRFSPVSPRFSRRQFRAK